MSNIYESFMEYYNTFFNGTNFSNQTYLDVDEDGFQRFPASEISEEESLTPPSPLSDPPRLTNIQFDNSLKPNEEQLWIHDKLRLNRAITFPINCENGWKDQNWKSIDQRKQNWFNVNFGTTRLDQINLKLVKWDEINPKTFDFNKDVKFWIERTTTEWENKYADELERFHPNRETVEMGYPYAVLPPTRFNPYISGWEALSIEDIEKIPSHFKDVNNINIKERLLFYKDYEVYHRWKPNGMTLLEALESPKIFAKEFPCPQLPFEPVEIFKEQFDPYSNNAPRIKANKLMKKVFIDEILPKEKELR